MFLELGSEISHSKLFSSIKEVVFEKAKKNGRFSLKKQPLLEVTINF